ncbi:MAG: hypothetical protein JRH20_26530 [Deltaproteobacteria bacterium]|nr:hypothetical protein [Deltaproteobacteria bacterium]
MRRLWTVFSIIAVMASAWTPASAQGNAPADSASPPDLRGIPELPSPGPTPLAPPKNEEAKKKGPWHLGSTMGEVRVGAHVGLEGSEMSGAALELTLGLQFESGLAFVTDFAFSTMFSDGLGDETLEYIRAGAGLRWTFGAGRARPWLQVTGGLHAYSLQDGDGEVLGVLYGGGVSNTLGLDLGITRIGALTFWAGVSGGVDVGFFDGDVDVPVRAMLTLALRHD